MKRSNSCKCFELCLAHSKCLINELLFPLSSGPVSATSRALSVAYLLHGERPQATTASEKTPPTTQHRAGHTVGLQPMLTAHEGPEAGPPELSQLLTFPAAHTPNPQSRGPAVRRAFSYLVSKQ